MTATGPITLRCRDRCSRTLILDALRRNLMRPELVAEFVRSFNEETNRAQHAAELQVEARRRELASSSARTCGLARDSP